MPHPSARSGVDRRESEAFTRLLSEKLGTQERTAQSVGGPLVWTGS